MQAGRRKRRLKQSPSVFRLILVLFRVCFVALLFTRAIETVFGYFFRVFFSLECSD